MFINFQKICKMIRTDNLNPTELPYGNESSNRIYEMLFCDNTEFFRPEKKFESVYPWNILFSNKYLTDELLKITSDSGLESRIKILAYNKLLSSGFKPAKKELLGIIIEVGLAQGLDVVAAYRDGTARYINYTERMIFWDSPVAESNNIIDHLFNESEIVLKQIGPWNKARLKYPGEGMVRISFLVSDGLYFGQGASETFFNERLSRSIMKYGSVLMTFLINISNEKG